MTDLEISKRPNRPKVNAKHGEAGRPGANTRTPEYKTWVHFREDCRRNGKEVSESWNIPGQGYANFLADMGRKPNPKCWLLRKDRTKPYNKENCFWFDKEDEKVKENGLQ